MKIRSSSVGLMRRTGWSAAVLLGAWVLGAAATARGDVVTFQKKWEIPAGTRDYVTTGTTGNTERGIAVNPVTGHVLLVSRAAAVGGLKVVILNGQTGEEIGALDTSLVSGGTFKLSTIGVADDGAIYAANLVTSASETAPFRIYRWADESAPSTEAYVGPPSASMRFGDSFEVRGAGVNTQLAAGSGGTATAARFAVFTTTDGATFTAQAFAPAGVSAATMAKGIAFGAGDTVYGKANGTAGIHASFDLTTGESVRLHSVPIESNISPIGTDVNNTILAGANYSTHRLIAYDISDPADPFTLVNEVFPAPVTSNANGVGAVDFGGGLLVALDTQNGVIALSATVSTEPSAPIIAAQPQSVTVLETAPLRLSGGAVGTQPLSYQWYRDGTLLAGETARSLSLTSVQPSDAGTYTLVASNSVGTATSDAAVVRVTALARSGHLTPLWSLAPGSRTYVATDNNQRGAALNPVNNRVLLVSRTHGQTNIYVLDADTGEELHRLQSTGPSGEEFIFGGTFLLNLVGAADDGAVYAANLTTTGSGFTIYRWANDAPDTPPSIAYEGSPTADSPASGLPAQRWGDTLSVRGSGIDTQIICAARNTNAVAIFTTLDGATFLPTIVTVAEAAGGDFGLGVDFGAGDTFWAKSTDRALQHIAFDLTAGTGTVLHKYASPQFPNGIGPIAVDAANSLLAGVAVIATPDNVQLFDVSVMDMPPALLQQEIFPADNANANGTGAADFTTNRFLALDSNNGLMVFTYDPDAVAPLMILTQPETVAAAIGENVTFRVSVSGSPVVTFQWQLDGVNLEGQTNSSLVLTNIQASQAGSYRVAVSGPGGSTTSEEALLKLPNIAPELSIALYAGITIEGLAGRSYRIEYTEDVAQTTGWTELISVTLPSPSYLYIDPDSAGRPKRFYRAIAQ